MEFFPLDVFYNLRDTGIEIEVWIKKWPCLEVLDRVFIVESLWKLENKRKQNTKASLASHSFTCSGTGWGTDTTHSPG